MAKYGHFPTTDDAAAAALHAGCDVSMGSAFLGEPLDKNRSRAHGNANRDGLEAMVGNGTIRIGLVQRAAVRVLTNRILLGELIDATEQNPWRNLTLESELPKNRALARRAARESVVLLRNRNGTLPMQATQLRSVAVVGPSADSASAYLGDYAPQPSYYTTAFSGAKEALPHATYLGTAAGCFDIFCGVCSTSGPVAPPECVNETDFGPAIAAASKAKDLVVFVGGLNGTFNYAEGEGTKHDRASVLLLGKQEQLMMATYDAAKKNGAKFVVVLLGSAVAATWAEAHADALISAGYGGQEAGNAIWDVITGEYNPSGRLANTWPANDAQLPPIGDYTMRPTPSSPGRTYQYLDEHRAPPLFRFAEGLSYGESTFSNLQLLSGESVDVCAVIRLSVDVTHQGPAGDVVLHAFLRFENATVPVPKVALVDFAKAYNMTDGETRTITMELDPERRAVITK